MKDDKTAAYFCTGVFATPDEVKLMKDEYSLPVMMFGGRAPEPEKTVHRMALSHGLPEIRGFYGCDLRDGEFIREKDASEGDADRWPVAQERADQ